MGVFLIFISSILGIGLLISREVQKAEDEFEEYQREYER